MSTDTTIAELVRQLQHAGMRPPRHVVQRILTHGDGARAPLIELATSTHKLYEAEPICWGPLHALRLLGEIPDVSMLPPLLSALPVEIRDEHDQATELWAAEVLDVASECGPDAIPLLWEWVSDTSHSQHSRGAALHTLVYIAYRWIAYFDTIVEEARTRLRQQPDMTETTFLAFLLANLTVADAYDEVMAAYREKRVDTAVLSASQARQMILSGIEPADYTSRFEFWERYDIDGPFERSHDVPR
jgi:hypothetical protein